MLVLIIMWYEIISLTKINYAPSQKDGITSACPKYPLINIDRKFKFRFQQS